jgi:hypothetical protein
VGVGRQRDQRQKNRGVVQSRSAGTKDLVQTRLKTPILLVVFDLARCFGVSGDR